jgi:hypothetical protein
MLFMVDWGDVSLLSRQAPTPENKAIVMTDPKVNMQWLKAHLSAKVGLGRRRFELPRKRLPRTQQIVLGL